MTVEYSICALPRSVAADAGVHVSLFVAPRLSPDGTLADFGPMRDWPKALAGAATTITLSDQFGDYGDGVTAALPADSSYWAAVFPLTTPVRAWNSTGIAGRRLHSFGAQIGVQAAKALHATAFADSAIDPPAPNASTTAEMMLSVAAEVDASVRGEPYDERRATAWLDTRLARGSLPSLAGRDGRDATQGPLQGAQAMVALVGDLHRARRFFERPESELLYKDRPDPGAVSPRLTVPKRDFHERITLLGDQPALLRRLGLIIDLRVVDLERLRGAEWLTGHISLDDVSPGATLPTRVRCRPAGDNLVTVGRNGGDWHDGRLRVGDTARFAMLDLDPDASALKLDRFLWTTPRLIDLERRGEPGHAAPPTLKGHGFSVARKGHAADLADRQAQTANDTEAKLDSRDAPMLHTEDVTRGVRVEVWDATEQGWFTLHAREREITVDGLQPFTVREEGWVQTGTVQETQGVEGGTVYVHEQLFAWSGWSLSVAHPALSVAHSYAPGSPEGGGAERNEDILAAPVPPPDPQLHVVSVSRLVPGTLPRLRYGREYALRAWSVDLAGASPAHRVHGTPPSPPSADLRAAAELALSQRAPVLDVVSASLARTMRAPALEQAATAPPAGAQLTAQLDQLLLADDEPLRHLLLARADELRRAARAPDAAASRRGLVERAVAPLRERAVPLVSEIAGWQAEALAAAVHAGDLGAVGLGGEQGAAGVIEAALNTVTAQRPLLRWHPVDPPALVPRAAYSAGESLRHLVVRSEVQTTRDPEQGDTIKLVTAPTAATCERHIAPPKTSQLEAELQGCFDDAIGANASPADRLRAVLVARREAGTFLDTTMPSLTDPAGQIPIDGVQLVPPTLAADPDAPLPDLPLQRGDPLPAGAYVIHTATQAVLPYLPDPLARGVSLVFPEAGLDRPLRAPISVEGTTADYAIGERWPELKPFRLILRPGATLGAEADERTITLALPPADRLRVRLASSIARDGLDLLGFWRSLDPQLRDDPALREAAVDGWLWPLSPAEEVVFVHAVPKPLEAPRPTLLRADRDHGDTGTFLMGAIDVHGPSTERVDVEASWTQQEDDVAQAGPDDVPRPDAQGVDQRTRHAVACTLPITEDEDMAGLFREDLPPGTNSDVPIRLHRTRHEFGDTRHRVVAYRFRASTRFREYFPPAQLADLDDRSVVGPVRRISIPNAARPAKPAVEQILPLFRWEEETEPEQPFGVRRRRRAGIRVYLQRPWYSSGDGELLGVLVDRRGSVPETLNSRWGGDPIWRGVRPAHAGLDLELETLWGRGTFEDRDQPARPVRSEELPLVDNAPHRATVLGYRPEYDPERRLWFADIAIDPGPVAWPFVRLALVRYQPESLAGCHLSPVVRGDYVQVPFERTATLSRPDDRTARVVVSGPIALRDAGFERLEEPQHLDLLRDALSDSRRLRARLERRVPAVGTDLGWTTVADVELRLEGFDADARVAAWVGSIATPEPVALRRPADAAAAADWRVTIEETEWLPADPPPNALVAADATVKQPRVVYLDHLEL